MAHMSHGTHIKSHGTHINTHQRTATHCDTLKHPAAQTHCDILQHTQPSYAEDITYTASLAITEYSLYVRAGIKRV